MADMPALDWVGGAPEDLRAIYAAQRAELAHEVAADVTIEESRRDGLPGLVFTPKAPQATPLLHFHGGGWGGGSPETHVTLCAWLAHVARRRVISVRYRLAPEHPWPAQREDALARMAALGAPCFLAGDSAGAAMALWAEAAAPEAVYGTLAFYGAFGVVESPSIAALAARDGALQQAEIRAFYTHLGLTDPAELPAEIQGSFLKEGPPLLIVKAAEDTLACDCEVLAGLMPRRALTRVTAEGQPHAFLQHAARNPAAREIFATSASWMDKLAP